MQILSLLEPDGHLIYNMIAKKVRIIENAAICRQYEIFGWFDSKKKTFIVCTDQIKTSSNPSHYANETIFHEAVHVAQTCKSGDGYIEPFGIAKTAMGLTVSRKKALNKAVAIAGEKVRSIEHEAFWMEDKPEKVRYVLNKYCF